MRKKTLLLTFILLYCVPASGATQPENLYFMSLDNSDGLSQNSVNAMIQDSKGYFWIGTKDGLNRFDGNNFRIFRNDPADPASIGSNFVRSLYEDPSGTLWVGCDAGLYLYDPVRDAFSPFSVNKRFQEHSISLIYADNSGNIWIGIDKEGLFRYDTHAQTVSQCFLPGIKSNINSFCIDHSGTAWLGFYSEGLYYSDDGMRTIRPFRSDRGEEMLAADIIYQIREDGRGCLYVSSIKRGLLEIDLRTSAVREILNPNQSGESILIPDFLIDPDSGIWIGTNAGLYVCDPVKGTMRYHGSTADDPYSLSDNSINLLFRDRRQGMWIGTNFGGINYIPRFTPHFEKYYPQRNKDLRGKRIREFAADPKGMLWIGTEDGGLNRFDPATGRFTHIGASKAFPNIQGLCADGDCLWVGTLGKGLKKIDTRTGQVVGEFFTSDSEIDYNHVFSVCKTSDNELLAGVICGLLRYDSVSRRFVEFPDLNGLYISDIREDRHGDYWLASNSDGVFKYSCKANCWINFRNYNTPGFLSANKVLSIFEDSGGRIWVNTLGGGFCKYDSATKTFKRYTTKEGLPSDVVYQIVEDGSGQFWISTDNGLVRFDPRTEKIQVFTTADGLLSNRFNNKSSYKSPDGTIYFGTVEGFIAFRPDTFVDKGPDEIPEITEFILSNRFITPRNDGSPLSAAIDHTDRLTLAARQNSFSFRLAALDFAIPGQSRLVCKLEGHDKEWGMAPDNNLVSYTNVRHGKYRLRVGTLDRLGNLNPRFRELEIHIRPPFYQTGLAYFFYFVLLAGAVVFVMIHYRRRIDEKHQLEISRFEQAKEREVYQAKISFFTNIAHEIRTPLTLIRGPLENIIRQDTVRGEAREDLAVMEQNTDRLLALTNQLLDFRKIEHKGFRLRFAPCDIVVLMRNTFNRFVPYAKQRGIKFSVQTSGEPLMADVDHEALTKILSNLFSNAIKYSAGFVRVSLADCGDGNFRVEVVNDGELIPLSMREQVFRPFVRVEGVGSVQAETGTGIGLSLARSLAGLHDGSLELVPDEELNIFRLTLPLHRQDSVPVEEEPQESGQPAAYVASGAGSDKEQTVETILVVEDDPGLRAFLSRQLSKSYKVLTASNGLEALDVLEGAEVHLIVSDIIMPEMDGLELCEKVRGNLYHSHIPLILLTARTDLQSKIRALEIGADSYIDKPFSADYLDANIAALLSQRRKLREFFSLSPFIETKSIATSRLDEEFLRKLYNIIGDNLDNPDFNIDEMAGELFMSRSSFYRKIKSISDLTPNEYLRLERLKTAAKLLREGIDVNDVCYRVGFTSRSYFTKCFTKQFGVQPKDFR